MRRPVLALLVLLAAASTGLVAQAVDTPRTLPRGDVARFRGVADLLRASVVDRAFPGAVILVGWRGDIVYLNAVGRYGRADQRPVSERTVYDLASLTKVVGLTTGVMLLVADGRLEVDLPVSHYLPAFHGAGKEDVTVRHLLTHTSGLPAWRPLHLETSTPQQAFEAVLTTPLETPPGERYVYSDIGAITLGLVVERVSGLPLDRFLHERIFAPLGMGSTTFLPPATWRDRIAPTEQDPWRGRLLRGEVHDENAARLGGVAGHAGLFSTGVDLGRFATWMLDAYHGRLDASADVYVPPAIVRTFTARQRAPVASTRALGWDTPSREGSSAGTLMSRSSFGHTGFTGTSIWIDPEEDLFVILLTNRVHPTRANTAIGRIRGLVADSVVTALHRDRDGANGR